MNPNERQEILDRAERLVARGKLNSAIRELRKIIAANPDDTSTLNRVGDLYVRLKRLDDAIELFRQAAENFELEGFFVKAIAIYKKILRLDTSQLEVSECLADLQQRQGLQNDARRQYEAVAENYLNRGDVESSIAVHRKLIDVDPDDPGHRLRLAELLKSNDRIPEAMGQYKGIADVFLSRGLVEDAVKVCLQALALAPQNTDFIAGVARSLNANGHLEEAESFLQAASEKNPEAGRISLQPPTPVDSEPQPTSEEVEVEEELEVEEAEAEDEVREEVESVEVVDEDQEEAVEVEAAEEEEIEFDIDLDEFEVELEEKAEAIEDEEAVEEPVEAAAESSIEEEPVAEPAAAAADEIEDPVVKELLIEADVLAKYELEDKAIEKYEEVIVAAPGHIPAYEKLIDLLLEHQSFARVAEVSMTFRQVVEDASQPRLWDELETRLVEAGFTVEGETVVAPEPVIEEPVAAEPVEGEQDVAAEASVEAGADDLSWLDQEAPAAAAAGQAEAEVYEEEEEFFDLASELERELDVEAGDAQDLEMVSEEQSIEEIVEGFRKGMAETLSPEDYDTHYNLGIAYREMGLVDEAISEFQLAAKDPRYLIDCCSLLASCFVEKGFPELAIKWYNEGLDSPTISQEEVLGLQYELGDLYLTIGESEEAKQRFVEIYGVNSDYRDVSSKLASLEQA